MKIRKFKTIYHFRFVDYEILQSLEFNVTYCQSRDEPRQYNPKIWIAVYERKNVF